jgi:polyhydroxyalkanoate synthesis regulator phasin
MPQKNAQGIDVSAEEERFLRSAFRRFALPYAIGFAAIAGLAWLMSGSDGEGASPEAMAALRAEVEALRISVATLEEQLVSMGADVTKAGSRVAALEKKTASNAKAADPDLEKKLRDATSRVSRLEKQLADQAIGERFDALAQRMTKIERESRAAPPMPAAPAQPPAGLAPSPTRTPTTTP